MEDSSIATKQKPPTIVSNEEETPSSNPSRDKSDRSQTIEESKKEKAMDDPSNTNKEEDRLKKQKILDKALQGDHMDTEMAKLPKQSMEDEVDKDRSNPSSNNESDKQQKQKILDKAIEGEQRDTDIDKSHNQTIDEPASVKISEESKDVQDEKKTIGHREEGENDEDKPQQDEGKEEGDMLPVIGKKSKKGRKKGVDPDVFDIRRRLQMACRDDNLEAAIEAYEEAIAKQIPVEAQSFYNLLNLCGGLGRTNVHIGTPKVDNDNDHLDLSKTDEMEGMQESSDVDKAYTKTKLIPSRRISFKERLEHAFKIKDHMTKLNLPLNEAAYSAVIKLLAKNKEFDKAERMLDEAESVQQCKAKLRLYSALLTAYCEDFKMLEALKCWKRLKKNPDVDLTEREYNSLMRCATSTGDNIVMEQVLSNLAEEVLVPSKDTVAVLIEWFEITHSQHTKSLTRLQADSTLVKQLLDDILGNNTESSSPSSSALEPPPSMGPVVDTNGWMISSACRIEPGVGRLVEGCLKGRHLKPVPLSTRAFDEMLKMNEAIVLDGKVGGHDSDFQGGRKGKEKSNFSPEARQVLWKKFKDFLESRDKPYDVVVDGANLGYFNQNFADAPRHVDYEQIDWVVRHFQEEKDQRVLLVMHCRHFADGMMPPKYRHLRDSWEKQGILYKTPHGMNDDWFWMHAALHYKTLVVTNDEMRDHHFQMLAPRFFLRWKERQQIHFDFGPWTNDASTGQEVSRRPRRKVLLAYPKTYSRRIQRVADGLVIPLAKRGDEDRHLDGNHVASDDEPEEETYLCIRPKKILDEDADKKVAKVKHE